MPQGVKLLRTSSVIKRGIRIDIFSVCSKIVSKSFSQEGSRTLPKEKIYSLLSRMRSKFCLPKFFSCFADSINNLLFAQSLIGRAYFRHQFTNFLKMQFSFFNVGPGHIHHLTKNVAYQEEGVKR